MLSYALCGVYPVGAVACCSYVYVSVGVFKYAAYIAVSQVSSGYDACECVAIINKFVRIESIQATFSPNPNGSGLVLQHYPRREVFAEKVAECYGSVIVGSNKVEVGLCGCHPNAALAVAEHMQNVVGRHRSAVFGVVAQPFSAFGEYSLLPCPYPRVAVDV